MRVFMTADTMGGVWTYAVDLCSELASLGHEVTVASLGDEPTAAQRAQIVHAGASLRVGRFPIEWMEGDIWGGIAECQRWLVREVEAAQPDVVHCNSYTAGDALHRMAPTVLVAHSCVCSWWRAVHKAGAPARFRQYRDLVRRSSLASDVLIAPTHAMLGAFLSEHGPASRPRVVLNGVAPRHESPRPCKDALVLGAGRLWDKAKNAAALVTLAERIGTPVLLAGAGDPTGEPEGGKRPRNLVSLGQVSRDALRRTMARASVFVHPARYEPFGLAPVEAARERCALVLGDIPTLREIWGDCALYADPDDDDAIEAAIRALLEDDSLRWRMADAACARAECFRSDRMAKETVAAYEAAIEAHTRKRAAQIETALKTTTLKAAS